LAHANYQPLDEVARLYGRVTCRSSAPRCFSLWFRWLFSASRTRLVP